MASALRADKRPPQPDGFSGGPEPVGVGVASVSSADAPPAPLLMAAGQQPRGSKRHDVSLLAVKKALSATGYDVPRINSRVNQTVRNLVADGMLVQTAGTGASGSFKINRQLQVVKGAAGKFFQTRKRGAPTSKVKGAVRKPWRKNALRRVKLMNQGRRS
ncbi:histone H1.2-like [Mobula hypostoma]|uniref:histone H1.2-like n=1 Tax=Mobula hypostoma TaxID=723540 RepID=UPI002FC36935